MVNFANRFNTSFNRMLNYDDTLEEYILEHIDPEPDHLRRLYRDTHLHHLYPRMCSGHYQGRLLKMLTSMIKPQRVLELGTFTGYSALSLAEGLGPNCTVDTIEIDEEKRSELMATFSESPYASQIHLHIGDALEVIKKLSGPYDLVFIDANKRYYLNYLEAVLPLVPVGAFIMADNTLWDTKVVNHGKDSQTEAISEFNDVIAKDCRFEKIILPVRDGLTIMRRVC